jgi:NAD-dependent deacetylase
MKTIVIFTGAGMSAESGLKTFRDSDGLWEQYRIEDVATPIAWQKNHELVLDFYNQRRRQVLAAEPNAAHKALVKLETKFNVEIITQNIDDLHERAGSSKVLHIHGEIIKSRSTIDSSLIYNINGSELNIGDVCAKGSQLRPHIVWFGEDVPMFEKAALAASKADYFIIIGTSLNVYPAAGLLNYVNPATIKYYIDPNAKQYSNLQNLSITNAKAGDYVPVLVEKLLK